MLRGTVCALLLVSPSAAALPAPQRPPQQQRVLVEEVEIEGNRRLTDEELLAHVRVRPGQAYDERQVQRDLQALLELGLLDTTETRVSVRAGVRGGKVVAFTVAELPLFGGLKLKGLPRGVTRGDVLRAARANGAALKKGAPCDPGALGRAVAAVRALLRARGLSGLSAEGYVEVPEPGLVVLRIEVTGGRYF